MKLKTTHIYPPIPDRTHDWSAHFPDLYDGAPDAGTQLIGYGRTELDAVRDLAEQTADLLVAVESDLTESKQEADRLEAADTLRAHENAEAIYELRERGRMDNLEMAEAMKTAPEWFR